MNNFFHRQLPCLILAFACFVPVGLLAQARKGSSRSNDYQASRQLKRAEELLAMNEEERGVKLLSNIPQLYPTSKVRFEAFMALGRYYINKKQYSLAVKQFNACQDAEQELLVAEAMYETGKCFYFLNQYNNAFSSLRKVTTNYPNSVFANQAYYYIGMCHFTQKHWKKSIDALKMVGTAVSQEDEGGRFTEAGQRFFVKIHDKDLIVLSRDGKGLDIKITTKRGDSETVHLSVLDKKGEYFIGSLPTKPGAVKPGNNIVEVAGGDTISTQYVDANTAAGDRMVARDHETSVVSTASVAFTDGAYENVVKGVFLGQDVFIKVRDLDLDLTDQPDKTKVKLLVQYIVKPEENEDEGRTGFDLGEDIIEIRDELEQELVETGPHTGVFTAVMRLVEIEGGTVADIEDSVLHAKQGDQLRVEYVDALHIDGFDEVDRAFQAALLGGSMNDVMAQVRVVNDFELRAKKNLIEAAALTELAGIFKKVGLMAKCREKAEEGLGKADEVILNRKLVPREMIEEAMKTKWELYLIIDELTQAVATCRQLMTLFPESTLVDQAMIQIGQANVEKGDFERAISIYNSVLAMPNSEQQPLAAFRIGEAYESMAEEEGRANYLNNAMKSYQHCAAKFPDSNYAGQSLDKVANFYLKMKDYQRAADLMSNVAQDFPDLDIMDKMLLKWAIALYRLKRYEEAYEKLSQLLNEYPESTQAAKAKQYRGIIGKKIDKAKAKAKASTN